MGKFFKIAKEYKTNPALEKAITSRIGLEGSKDPKTIKTISYYKKFHWKLLNKKKFSLMDHKSKKFGMVFNNKDKLKETKFLYFTN